MANAGVVIDVQYKYLSFAYFSETIEKCCYLNSNTWKMYLFFPKQAVYPLRMHC